MIPIWILVSILIFFLKAHTPIDEAEVRTQMLLQNPDHPEYTRVYSEEAAKLGLDMPLFYITVAPDPKNTHIYPPTVQWHGRKNQYHRWWISFFSSRQTNSLIDGRSVYDKIAYAMSWTVLLALGSLLITLGLGIPLGMYQARHTQSLLDRLTNLLGSMVYSMPLFWLGTVAILFFTSRQYGSMLHWFSAPGLWRASGEGFFSQLIANIDRMILPILLMSVKDIAYVSRLVRASFLEEASKVYPQALKAKGLSQSAIYRKHIGRNALSPIITLIVSSIPNIIGGALIIEVLFNIPGMGRLVYESIVRADWPVVFPIVMLSAGITMFSYLIGDVLLAFLYPKLRSHD